MKISAKQYAQSLYEVVKDKKDSQIRKIIKNFSRILINNNDILKIDKITAEFVRIWNRERGIVEAEIIGARKFDNKIIKLLNDYIIKLSGAKKIEIKQTVDKNILGGVIIRYEDRVIDGSLKTKLSELKNKMIK